MTPRPLVVLGGGEHARVVIDAAVRSGDWRVEGFTDLVASEETERLTGVKHLGDDEAVLARLRDGSAVAERPCLVLGVGRTVGSGTRHALLRRAQGAEWAVVVHPAATVAPSAAIGEGTVIFAGAVVNPGAEIGRHVIVNTGAIVEHDVVLGDGTHVAPGAVLGGGVSVGADAFIGLGALVRDHVHVGAGATVGMGSVVVRDVPDGATVLGNPARVVSRG